MFKNAKKLQRMYGWRQDVASSPTEPSNCGRFQKFISPNLFLMVNLTQIFRLY